ncbi:MAG: hypothetical protein ACOC6C_05285, partial [Verrucomicrobiota bacterium]
VLMKFSFDAFSSYFKTLVLFSLYSAVAEYRINALLFGFHLRVSNLVDPVGPQEIRSVDEGPTFRKAVGKYFGVVRSSLCACDHRVLSRYATFLRS